MTEKERRKFQALTPEEVEEAMAKSKGAKDRLKTFYALLDDALWKKNKLKQYKEIAMTEEDEEFNRIEREAAMRTAAVKATVTKREWVGLTLEEMDAVIDGNMTITDSKLRDAVYAVVLDTMTTLMEKNSG